MKRVVRRGVFETNSSSDSALFFVDGSTDYYERCYNEIFELTNDGYRKTCFAMAMMVGDGILEVKHDILRELRDYFLDFYCERFQVEKSEKFLKKMDKDVKKIAGDYFSTIGIGDTCLFPLLDKYTMSYRWPNRGIDTLPPKGEILEMLTKFYSEDSYVVYAQDEL